MAIRPLWNTVWGVPIYDRPFREEASIDTPFAKQRKKLDHLILIKEVGKGCKEAYPGMVGIIPEDNGGAVITVMLESGELEYRYCMCEDQIMAEWTGELPVHATEAGIINLDT